MSILGIDYGLKRIGIACTDELKMFSHPIKQIENISDDHSIKEIINILATRKIDLILVGVPFKSDGRLKIQDYIEDFVKKLKKVIKIDIKFWDENFTTDEAESFLISHDISRKKRKKVKDMLSACKIIDSYLRSIK